MIENPFIKYEYDRIPVQDILHRAITHYHQMDKRRSIRDFSDTPVPKEIIHHMMMTASSAPSGAHKQPWTFCAVQDPKLKRQIRIAAEKEEYKNYHGRMSKTWLDDLAYLGTDWKKPFLEKAPWLIIIFKKPYDILQGQKKKNYYVNESVGIAAGFLISAIHQAGLVTLTHTPSPMNFLQKILNRPENEKAFLLLPVGYPKEDALVPNLKRKSASEVVFYY